MEQENNSKEKKKEIGELHPKEVALIFAIREEYRYGSIEIQTKDGLPNQILRTIDRKLL